MDHSLKITLVLLFIYKICKYVSFHFQYYSTELILIVQRPFPQTGTLMNYVTVHRLLTDCWTERTYIRETFQTTTESLLVTSMNNGNVPVRQQVTDHNSDNSVFKWLA